MSPETPATINPIVNVRNVNPIRIVFITKLPNKLIERNIISYPAEDFTVCTPFEYISVKIECSSFHMLTAYRTPDSSVEISRTIAARNVYRAPESAPKRLKYVLCSLS